MASGAAKQPAPACPKALSRALSLNSPTMRGRTPWVPIHWSRARRSAVPCRGSSQGCPSSAAGNPPRRLRARGPDAKTDTPHSPRRWLKARRRLWGSRGRSVSTTSRSWVARAASRRSVASSRARRRGGSASCRAGSSSFWTMSLGRASEMPTARCGWRAVRPPPKVSRSSWPRPKISSAYRKTMRPASVRATPRPAFSKSRSPRSCSRARICALRVGWERRRAAAPLPMPPSRAAVQK